MKTISPIKIATQWREQKGYTGKGGVVVLQGDGVSGWMNELRNPEHWSAGCVAVDESGRTWLAAGGDETHGAETWRSVDVADVTYYVDGEVEAAND